MRLPKEVARTITVPTVVWDASPLAPSATWSGLGLGVGVGAGVGAGVGVGVGMG